MWAPKLLTDLDQYDIPVPEQITDITFRTIADELLVHYANHEQWNIQQCISNANFHINYKHIELNNKMSYIKDITNLHDLRWIVKARFEMLALNYKPWLEEHDNLCKFCNLQAEESVMHIMAECPIYIEFRLKYFHKRSLLDFEVFNILKGELGWKMLSRFIRDVMTYRDIWADEN